MHFQDAHLQPLRGGPDLDDLRHLLLRVGQRPDDEQPVEQVARNAVRGDCKKQMGLKCRKAIKCVKVLEN